MSRRRNLAFGWLLALAAMAAFARLGDWQLDRADGKQAMLDAAAQVLAERVPVSLAAAADSGRVEAYDWAAGSGRFDARGPLWLDNQQREGRIGVRAYRLFVPDAGAPLLVDLGWLPLDATRTLPAVPRPEGVIALRGLLAPPPASGLPLGPGIVDQGNGWLLTRVDTAAIVEAVRLSDPLALRVLRLDPALPFGHERDLELLPNTLPPAKHIGYAVQWFALALAVLVVALVLTFRRRTFQKRRHPRPSP